MSYLDKSEVDKLVEDFCEPSEKMKYHRNVAIYGEAFVRDGKVIDNDRVKRIGADIQKNGITYSDGKKHFKVEAKFKCVDKMSYPLFKIQKTFIEKELDRELTDFEAEQILAFMESEPSEKIKKHFFRQFMNDGISCDEYRQLVDDEEILNDWSHETPDINADLERAIKIAKRQPTRSMTKADYDQMIARSNRGKLKNTDYPDRTHFKKKENLLSKVVKWWLN